jgi:hypothetical protein
MECTTSNALGTRCQVMSRFSYFSSNKIKINRLSMGQDQLKTSLYCENLKTSLMKG